MNKSNDLKDMDFEQDKVKKSPVFKALLTLMTREEAKTSKP